MPVSTRSDADVLDRGCRPIGGESFLAGLRDGGDFAALSSPHSDWYADQMEAA